MKTSKELQIEIMKFFMKTSIPTIIKEDMVSLRKGK